MQITFETNGQKTKQPKVYLCKPGEKKSCILNSIKSESVSFALNLQAFSTFEFEIDQYVYDDYSQSYKDANGYNAIGVHMELFVENIGWFRINKEPEIENDGQKEIKRIYAESIESELQDFDLMGFKVNYGTVDSIEMMIADNVVEYPEGLKVPKEQVQFYNPDNPQLSLLNIIIDGMYRWTIGHVDNTLKTLIYRFDIDNSNRYAFLMGEAATAYECVFVFDFNNFTINAYSFNDENVLNTGLFKDTNIIIGFRGVANTLTRTQNTDIYTVYNVNGGDGLNIYYANFGENRIENIDYFLTTRYMSQELIDKYIYWRDYRENRRPEYIELSKQYNAQLEVVSELKNRVPSAGCKADWTQISDDELLASYSNYLALKAGYEATYVDTEGNFDLTAIQNSIDWEDYYSVITYVIPALENEIGVRELDSQISDSGSIDYDYNAWETDWDLYGVDELQAKLDEYNELIKSLSDFSQESKPPDKNYTDDYYAEMRQTYLDYVSKRDSCQVALTERQAEYDEANTTLETLNASRQSIVTDVSKENEQFGFTDDDFFVLWKLYNEIDYVNENIIATSLDNNVTTVDIQNELYLDATEHLSTYSHPQYNYSSTLDNLLAMYDYSMFHKDFNCGNFVRVMTDDTHQVKLRITSISFNPFIMENDLSIQFSSMITSKNGRSDRVSLVGISSNQKANSITGSSSGGVEITQQLINALLKSPQFKNAANGIANNAANIVAGSIQAQSITVDELKAKIAQIDELEANSAFIKYLEATLVVAGEIQVDDLKAKLAQIDVAQVGDLFTESLQAFTATVAETTIDEAYIMNAIVGKLSVGDLAAGNIVLNNNMQILSENGKMIMNGSALQIIGTDANGLDYVGIQLGYDTESNPSLILRNENGATILTPEGITSDAIADKLIINDMLDDKSVGKRNMDWTDISEGVDENGNPIWDIANIYMNGEQFGAQYVSFTTETTKSISSLSDDVAALSDMVQTIELTGEQVFVDSDGTITPSSITISAFVKNNTVIDKWLVNGIENTSYVSADNMSITIPSSFMEGKKTISIKAQNADGSIYDVMSVYLVSDGADGDSPYQVILDNENITFSTNASRVPLSDQSFTCNVSAYIGTSPTTCTIGEIASANGITVAVSGQKITLSVSTTSAIAADSGFFNIPITIDDVVIYKVITWSCAQSGKDGGQGISVDSVDIWYYLSSSSTLLSDGVWATNRPEWENGKYIWSKTVTTLSDGTISESDPVCITGEKGEAGQGIEDIIELYYLADTKDITEIPDPPTDWVTTCPEWSSGMYIWTCSKFLWNNPAAITYSTPICDTSWEAANGVQANLDNAITTITDTIAGVELKVDKNTQSIENKVWQSDITESINNYDGTTVETIRDRVSKTEIDIKGITSTVSDVQSTLITKADGDTVSVLSDKVSQMKQDADGFKQTVERTYLAKGDLDITSRNLLRNSKTLIYESYGIITTETYTLTDESGNTLTDENSNRLIM